MDPFRQWRYSVEPRPMRDRVREAFGGVRAKLFSRQYLELSLQTWRDVETSLRRTSTLLAAFVIAFLLLADARSAEFDLGPFKIDDLGAMLVLIPAVVTQLFYDCVQLSYASARLDLLHWELLEHLYPSIAGQNLDGALSPGTVSMTGRAAWQRLRPAPFLPIERLFRYVIAGGFNIGVHAFVAYAFWRLFHRHHIHAAELWASLLFSGFNLLRTDIVGSAEARALF